MKSVKNRVEIEGTQNALIRDGVAMVNFLYWLDSNIGKIEMSEISIQNIDGWEEKYPAFKWCDDYTDASGNSQWYLPAKNELNQLYLVKDYVNATIAKIIAGGGTAKKLGTGCYWSSSQSDFNGAVWFQSFSDGYQYIPNKYLTSSVRAVRAF